MTQAPPPFSARPGVIPIVLLHGLTASWRVWRPILPHLPAERTFVVPLPGHYAGPAVARGPRTTIDTLVDGVCDQLDAAGVERAHLVGNSLGGWVALDTARRGRAVSVTAFSPAGAWTDDRDVRRLQRLFLLADRVSSARTTRRLARHAPVRKMLFGQTAAHPERINYDEAVAGFEDLDACTVMRELVEHVSEYGPILPFTSLPCPVTVSWAQKDRVIPFPRYGTPMIAALPGAQLIHMPDVGHVPMSDAPEHVARTILETVEHAETAAQPKE